MCRPCVSVSRTAGDRRWWSYAQKPDTKVYQWDGGWSTDSGDLVTNRLQCEVSPSNSVARRMLVSAGYARAATVKKLRDQP